MTKQVQRRRGTATQHTSFTGAEGEISVNTTNKSIHVHDGVTTGGIEAARADLTNVTEADVSAALAGATDVDINGGTIDGTVIGGTTAAAITGTTGQFNTSLNVDGTVTADGLTVDGQAKILGSAANTLVIADGTETNGYALKANTSSTVDFGFVVEDLSGKDLLKIESNGDVSFYNAAGSAQKFFWDASAERLGIGVTSPNRTLDVRSGTTDVVANFESSDAGAFIALQDNATTTDTAVMIGANGDDLRFDAGDVERMRITSSGSVGIGTASPTYILETYDTVNDGKVRFGSSNLSNSGPAASILLAGRNFSGQITDYGEIEAEITDRNTGSEDGKLLFKTARAGVMTEAARIDSSGNLLVGKTAADNTTVGTTIYGGSSASISIVRSGASQLILNRLSTDGDMAVFRKDGTTVGSIGAITNNYLFIGTNDAGLAFDDDTNRIVPWNTSTNTNNDAAIQLGGSTQRFTNLYLSGGVYLGGTGTANKLDDYEEGNFALTFTPDTGSITLNTSFDRASYVRIGNLVTVTGLGIAASVSSPTGNVSINLPFALSGGTDRMCDSAGAVVIHNSTANMRDYVMYATEGSSVATIRRGDATTFQSDAANAFVSGTQVYFSITYRAA